jgi:hypothetical protein
MRATTERRKQRKNIISSSGTLWQEPESNGLLQDTAHCGNSSDTGAYLVLLRRSLNVLSLTVSEQLLFPRHNHRATWTPGFSGEAC